jgi:uncharacterized damage-inducible protein DinB
MNADDFRKIFTYNWAVLHSFLDTIDGLPKELISSNLEASHNSMKDTFAHILTVYDGWLNHARMGESSGVPKSELDECNQSIENLRKYVNHVETAVGKLLESLTDSMLTQQIKVDWWDEPHSLADVLMQTTLEQAHHLGEIIALLWQHDIEPPEMTWIGTKEPLNS